MNKPSLPESIGKFSRSALKVMRSAGPLLISHSKQASATYADHKLRLAEVGAAKEMMIQEVQALSEVRAKLHNRFYDAEPDERINIKRDIEETERELRRFRVLSKSLDHLQDTESDEASTTSDQETETIVSPHWIDKFNEYARAHNEDWREDLLAKALSVETAEPGAIGPRALWLIGTIDEYLFHAYAALLDLSTILDNTNYIIPNYGSFNQEPIPDCLLKPHASIGRLVFLLSDLGLIGTTAFKLIPDNVQIMTRYDDKHTLITTKKQQKIKGIIPTDLGEKLGRLYTTQPSELGMKIYNSWLESLSDEAVIKVDTSP